MAIIMRRIITLLLIGMISSLSIPKTVIADNIDVVVPLSSDYFVSTNVKIKAETNGKIQVNAELTATKKMKKLGFEYIKIQKYENGRWSTVDTLDRDVYAYDSSMSNYLFTYKGKVGEQYRALVKFYAQDSNGSDTKIAVSNTITAKK